MVKVCVECGAAGPVWRCNAAHRKNAHRVCETCKDAATKRHWEANKERVMTTTLARYAADGGDLQELIMGSFLGGYCAPTPCPAPGCTHTVKGRG